MIAVSCSDSSKMSLLPILVNDVLNDWQRRVSPSSLFNQNFGLGIFNDDLLNTSSSMIPLLSGYYRPWRLSAVRNSGTSSVQNDKDGFKVNLDVQQFRPDEITVKMVGNSVLVEGKHEERRDEHGYISRQFQRRYVLPDDVNPDAVKSKLSSDGVLTIEAPKKALTADSTNERVITITQTNAPALAATTSAKTEGKGDGLENSEQ